MVTETKYLDNPICPYCGHIVKDAWEIDFRINDDQETNCNQCGKDFLISRHLTVTYSTFRINE